MRIRSKLLLNTIVAIVCLIIVGGTGLFFTHHVATEPVKLLHIYMNHWQQFDQITLQALNKEEAQRLITLRELIEEHMETRRDNTVKAQQQAFWAIITLTLLIGLFVLFFTNRLNRSLVTPLLLINTHLKMLAQGKEEDLEYHGKDEIAEIVQSSQQLKDSINKTIGLAHAIAAGNYAIEVKPRSDEDRLGLALSDMTRKLRETTAHHAEQDWIKTGQAQLNERMSCEQTIESLAKQIISFLTTYLEEAQVGLFYLLKDSAYLQLIASYAYTASDNRPDKFRLGEGLVGQAALEQKTFARAYTQDEYTHIIQSGLACTVHHYVLIIPFLYENVVKGVIEIGFSKTPTRLQQDFLRQTMPSIGIAVNTAESRTQLQVLLAQSQRQSEELQRQQQELQHSNEELQKSAEELEAQQEELRQINEKLEERTQDLEEQGIVIRQKNLALLNQQESMKKAQAALETKAKELELANQYKSEFLANMSHELRTPLNSMLILAQVLVDNDEGNLNDEEVKYAQTIHSAGSDLLALINEILDLSKVEAGKMEIHVEEVSLVSLVDKIEQKFRPLAQEKGLDFHVTLAEDLPPLLHTDKQRLQQIINNLLSNAFKFTSEGEIKLGMLCPENGTIAISVSDTGIGIPKDKQQTIFEAFRQANGSTSRHYGGTGLGLSISRQLARLLGGDLLLHSEKGKGSTFTLSLPESNISDDQASETETSTAIADDRANLNADDRSILIIEDDSIFSRIIIALALEKNFKCLVADDGEAGLQLAKQYQPNAILLDMSLPVMDGRTVMERLKTNPETRHIPVHVISAYDYHLQLKRMGAIGYLHKPVNIERLRELLKQIEQFMEKTEKPLLLVVDNGSRQQQFVDLVGGGNIQTTLVATVAEALESLKKASFDCLILDMAVESGTGIKLLEQLYKDEHFSQIPVILFADRELNLTENMLLQQYGESITVKIVHSPERLLEEATLFLHQAEAQLPQEQQQILRMVHDQETLLMNKKVLIVDDDIRNTFTLLTVLEKKGMEVIVGSHGKEALALLDEHPDVDLVLMDIMMPEMDGYEAMQKIREQARFQKLPMIALTAKAMKGDRAKCIEAGASDYLSKPVDTEKLLSLMRMWL
jgi:signal transduction histidine kinase/DNA-binding response OmpR family regulator